MKIKTGKLLRALYRVESNALMNIATENSCFLSHRGFIASNLYPANTYLDLIWFADCFAYTLFLIVKMINFKMCQVTVNEEDLPVP